jgi:hypothetical protein
MKDVKGMQAEMGMRGMKDVDSVIWRWFDNHWE